MKFRICGSRRHFDLLHLSSAEKKERAKKAGTVDDSQDNVNAKYTLVCKGTPGGLSCSKSVSVDIYGENPVHRAYAIMDDQSNASIISTELADKLNADGPEWKYFLSTFGSNREVSVTRNDYDVSLSIEDRRFTKIMDKGIHKNQLGSWEMPLPFCSTNVFMRNKRS